MSRLNDTVQSADPGAPPLTRSQLHALVREWSAMLKGEGLPPERVLVVVKRFVHEAIAPSMAHYGTAAAPEYRPDVLVTDASQWCIEAYFGDASSPRRTSPNEADGADAERRS